MPVGDFLRRVKTDRLHAVDNSPLIVFRILFGLLLAAETGGAILTGWVKRVLVEPEFTFPILPFTFLQPLPGYGMYFYFAAMAVAGLLVAAGAWFRISLGVYTVMWTAVYLMQTSSYNNHYYLLCLLCLLLLLTPANADLSWDARRNPAIRSWTCPRWCIEIFVAQIAIVYFYAAVAKLDLDWLQAKPMEIWLQARRGYYLGPFYELWWVKYALAWGGLLFDALVVPLLLWRRTRRLAVALSVFFHLFNSYTFRIGVFPYLALSLLVFFFPGERVGEVLLRRRAAGAPPVRRAPPWGRLLPAFLAVYFTLQVLLPLQSWWFPGDVSWTEEGYRMSWRMMLRTKDGSARFIVTDPKSGETWTIYPRRRLRPKQADRIATRPDMIWQFAQRLAREYRERGIDPVIRVDAKVSLNGRPRQPFIDPDYDMAKAEWHYFSHDEWVLPLRE